MEVKRLVNDIWIFFLPQLRSNLIFNVFCLIIPPSNFVQ